MKKIVVIIALVSLFSCNKKEVQLPQADKTVLDNVVDHSPIYMFFKTKKNDTLVDVNRQNSITSTSWIFHIDKRLPLRLVVPEIVKLQEKKDRSAHKSATSENYFSYSDSIHKQLAFVPFTKVKFKLAQPKFGITIYFTKNNQVLVQSTKVKKEDLITYLEHLPANKPLRYNFCFDKNANYGSFIKNMVFIESLGIEITDFFVY